MIAQTARRAVVLQVRDCGLSELQALRLVGMSASCMRYRPASDRNDTLRQRLKALAGQHRRHSCRCCTTAWRMKAAEINVNRTYRIYRQEGLMVRRRRRKKLPVPERQPLI